MSDTEPRAILMQIDEDTVDNLAYAKENMQKEHNLKLKNFSDVIAVLLKYWFEGKRN
jgi:hypothetical protein